MNKGKTPRIRFKGFTDDWEQRKLGDIVGKTYGGGTPATSNDNFWNGEIPWIQSSNLVENQLFEVDVKKYISREGVKHSATQIVPENSVAVVTHVGVGKLVFMPYVYTTSQDFISLGKLKCEPRFLCYALRKKIQEDIYIVQGSAIKGITKADLMNKVFLLPKINEQIRIANVLQNFDRLITLHQRKLEKLKIIKKSMLENCFPKNGEKVPKIRFSGFTGDWEQRKLGDLVVIERGGSPRPIDDYITGETDGLNWVKIGDAPEQGRYITHTAEKIKPSGLSKTRQVEPGDLILSNSMSFGKPYIMAISGCIHDGWLLIRNNQNIFNLKFLCQMLGSNQMIAQYKSLAAGSTVNNLNKDLVANAEVTFPKKDEQKKIGDFLEAIDKANALHQRKLEKLQKIKKSMLEKMFV